MSTIQVYANKLLAYDNRLPSYAMQSILIDEAVNKGGTCKISMFPGHPAYTLFPAFSTPVEVYRDGKLRWRGRPLPLADELYGIRTVVCEGELCWFNDVTIRPYLYQTDPESIFRDLVAIYNSVVEPWKRFEVGTVTVKDPNDYVRLESQSAAQAYDVLMKLIDRCGGYIFFESLEDGTRTINWYAEFPYSCNQKISLGSNLLNYSKQSNLTNFATRIIPYGAKNENGERLKINVDGKDYLQIDEAVALRGVIEVSVTWDDITLEENLISRANDWLISACQIPYSFAISAIDLSKQGKTVDPFAVGQRVPAESAVHDLTGYYDLTALQEDLCDPRIGGITLGKETTSLVGADVADKKAADESVDIVMKEVAQRKDEINDLAASTTVQITNAVQSSQALIFSALEEYAIASDVKSLRAAIAELQVAAGNVSIRIQKIEDDGVSKVKTGMGYTFDDKGMHVAKEGDEIGNLVDNRGIHVSRGAQTMFRVNATETEATNLKVNNYFMIANSRFEDYSDDIDSEQTALFYI